VRRGKRRVVLPLPANALLLGEALSPRIGDLIAYGLTRRPIARLVGMSRGTTYHETLLSRHGSSQRNVALATTQTSVE